MSETDFEEKKLILPEIRRAHLRDAEWIASAQLALASETESIQLDLSTVKRGVSHVFSHPDIGFYIAVTTKDRGTIACALVLKEWSDWRAAEVWWLHSVFVTPDARQQKVFTALYEWLKKTATESGAKGIRLYVDKTNTPARKTYQRIGMTNEHYEMFEEMFRV